jgi:hypothetical protein
MAPPMYSLSSTHGLSSDLRTSRPVKKNDTRAWAVTYIEREERCRKGAGMWEGGGGGEESEGRGEAGGVLSGHVWC